MIKTEMMNNIVENITMKGYDCKGVEVNKNGVILQGINFILDDNPNVGATMYLDDLRADELTDVDDIADILISRYIKYREQGDVPDFSKIVSCFFGDGDREYLFSHLRLCVRRAGIEDEVRTKPIRDTDLVSYVRLVEYNPETGNMSIALTKSNIAMLESQGIYETQIFNAARKNIRGDMKLKDMSEVLPPALVPTPSDIGIYVLTSNDGVWGACYFADKTSLNKVCKEIGSDKIIIIPSSIHELLVLPYSGDIDVNYINRTIGDVNSQCLNPVEILSDHAYTYVANL